MLQLYWKHIKSINKPTAVETRKHEHLKWQHRWINKAIINSGDALRLARTFEIEETCPSTKRSHRNLIMKYFQMKFTARHSAICVQNIFLLYLQNLKNQIMTTNLWVEQVRTSYSRPIQMYRVISISLYSYNFNPISMLRRDCHSLGTTTNYDGSRRNMVELKCFTCRRITYGVRILCCTISKFTSMRRYMVHCRYARNSMNSYC